MKVFLSWSGEPSRELALALADWLPRVLQVVEPFVSAVDIDKGDTWVAKLQTELESTDFGIICVTPTNLTSPWLHYEAGALGKSVESRVCPVLLGVTKDEVRPPFRQLQLTTLELADMRLLLRSMNKASGATVAEGKLDEAVDVWWSHLETKTNAIELSEQRDTSTRGTEPNKPHLSDRELMQQVLQEVRDLRRVVKRDSSGSGRLPRVRQFADPLNRNSLESLYAAVADIDPHATVSAGARGYEVALLTYTEKLPPEVKHRLSSFAVKTGVPVRVDKAGTERVVFGVDGRDDELPF